MKSRVQRGGRTPSSGWEELRSVGGVDITAFYRAGPLRYDTGIEQGNDRGRGVDVGEGEARETMDIWTVAKELAMEGFRDPGPDHLNCAQAVVRFAAHGLGGDAESVTLARYMGGGSVGMGEMCGAVEGAVLGLGLRDYLSPKEHPAVDAPDKESLQELIRDFRTLFGSATCRGLTGQDISSPEGYESFKADPISRRCDDYVAWACDRLGSILA